MEIKLTKRFIIVRRIKRFSWIEHGHPASAKLLIVKLMRTKYRQIYSENEGEMHKCLDAQTNPKSFSVDEEAVLNRILEHDGFYIECDTEDEAVATANLLINLEGRDYPQPTPVR